MITKKPFENKVVVIGSDHHNTLGIIRSLGEQGIWVYAVILTSGKAFTASSRYLKAYWLVKEEETAVINILTSEFNQEINKPVLIPSSDFSAYVLDRNYERLCNKFYVPSIGQKGNAIAKYMDKYEMNLFAQSNGLHVPAFGKIDGHRFMKPTEIEQLCKEKNITYPFILKPLRSMDGSKEFITVVRNFDDLERAMLKAKGMDLLIQVYINKEAEYGLAGYASILKKQVVIAGIVEKIRQSTASTGPASYGRIVKSNPYIQLDRFLNFVEHIQYDGIFDIDLMRSADEVYFIEINFRNGAYGYAYKKSGCNIPLQWCLLCLSESPPQRPRNIKEEIYFINEISDFRNVIQKTVPPLLWFRQLIKAKVKMVFNIKDVTPFLIKVMKGAMRG